ncbi:MAG: glycosyltransferase family 9 protein [Bacteroidota bacterium]|nr:glycosyltransferase family 9 protein [Bacteroidota bacterium]MEC8363728.1 glycosyltransferase family 9 protein [Bacteroidota bacterium]|tara:strand:- start:639 stop:1670 length:1032 start_codon:yes stop_codon:yes gene_type:complete
MLNSHIIVFRLSAMGDVAMCVPVIRAILKTYPNTKITMVTQRRFVPIFDGLKNVDFITPDLKNKHKTPIGLYKLFSQILRLRPTHIADLHQVIRTKLLMVYFKRYFWIKQAKIDKGRASKKRLTKKKIKTLIPLTPQIFRYAQVFEKLGFPISLSNDEIPVMPTFSKFKELNFENHRKIIGIAPFAAHESKQYPLDLMQKVVANLQREYNVVLFGFGDYEKNKLDVWADASKNVINSVGMFELGDEIQLIALLNLMISMDSANGHLASNYNVPVITLWGSTHPCLGFTPFGQPKENSIVSNRNRFPFIPTSVYGNKKVKGYEDVMRTIDPKLVIDLAYKILNN